MPITRFRYRTPALYGPWRKSREEAEGDAIRAGQAYRDPDEPEKIVWRDEARIEELNGVPSGQR